MHEIVTLQVGSQSNYVATHFWNTQESYFTYNAQEDPAVEHDVHFRQGVGADGSDTYTPRTVIYDFKQAFGTLRRLNALYDAFGEGGSGNNTWGGTTIPHQQPQIGESEYQRHLNQGADPPPLSVNSVRYWSDYNRVFYHPRSVVQIHETDIDPGARSFEDWAIGEELFHNLDKEHDLFDRDMRPFIEECDQMQGIQLLTPVEDGWSGFSARYLDRLRDEFGKLPIWVWTPGKPKSGNKAKQSKALANEARALYEMNTHTSLYLPLHIPNKYPSSVSFDPHSAWHTSALLSTVFESITLPSRLRQMPQQDPLTLEGLAMALTPHGNRRIASVDFRVDSPDSNADQQPCSLFPYDKASADDEDDNSFSRVEIIRAPPNDKDVAEDHELGRGLAPRDTTMVLRTPLLFPVLDSFPHIYNLGTPDPQQLEVKARISNSPVVMEWVQSLSNIAKRIIAIEDREEIVDGLQTIAQEYKEDAWSGSEEDGWED